MIKNLYLAKRFFLFGGGIAVIFVCSYPISLLLPAAKVLFTLFIAFFISDIIILFNRALNIDCARSVPKLMSLGDENKVLIFIENKSGLPVNVMMIDEIPVQFQKRDFVMNFKLAAKEKKNLSYNLRPVVRGEYLFGNINVYLSSIIGFVQRREVFQLITSTPVYPSIIQMKNMELKAFSKISDLQGIKRIRRFGHSYEFEQIKNYVYGDDYRSVNWKATSRKASLMVNQYEDERSQQVYSIVDDSRSMLMPFDGLSLLDYAINTSLVISNIALRKQDKAGLITFSEKVDTLLIAERSRSQLQKILESLYKLQEKNREANFELLYVTIRNFIKGRSLLFLYTNF